MKISVPYQDSQKQLAVQVALNLELADLVGEHFDFVGVADLLVDIQVRVKAAVFVLRG